jgi:hypothetical protein
MARSNVIVDHPELTVNLTQPSVVQIVIRQDGKTVWINVDGVCRLRVCRIEKLLLEDQRYQSDWSKQRAASEGHLQKPRKP